MHKSIELTPRRLMLIGLLGLVALATYGFAATNTVDPSTAGDGAGAITGYTATNVHYTLNGTNPSTIDTVSFTLNPPMVATGQTRISLNAGGTFLAAGACLGAGTITCTATGTTVLSLANLRVVAAQ